jgi:hypothetical protein
LIFDEKDPLSVEGGALIGGLSNTMSTLLVAALAAVQVEKGAKLKAAMYRYYFVGRWVIPVGVLTGAATSYGIKYRKSISE